MKRMPAASARPRRSFTSSPAVRDLRWVGCVAVLVAAVGIATVYPSLPAELPTRVAGDGAAADSGPRWMIWVLVTVWLAVQVLVAVLSTKPHLLNYPAPVTGSNAQRLYERGEEMLVWLGLAVATVFAGLVLLVLGVAAVPVVVFGLASTFAATVAGVVRLASAAEAR